MSIKSLMFDQALAMQGVGVKAKIKGLKIPYPETKKKKVKKEKK